MSWCKADTLLEIDFILDWVSVTISFSSNCPIHFIHKNFQEPTVTRNPVYVLMLPRFQLADAVWCWLVASGRWFRVYREKEIVHFADRRGPLVFKADSALKWRSVRFDVAAVLAKTCWYWNSFAGRELGTESVESVCAHPLKYQCHWCCSYSDFLSGLGCPLAWITALCLSPTLPLSSFRFLSLSCFMLCVFASEGLLWFLFKWIIWDQFYLLTCIQYR